MSQAERAWIYCKAKIAASKTVTVVPGYIDTRCWEDEVAQKRTHEGANFAAVWEAPLSDEDKDELMVHVLRIPSCFDEATSRLDVADLSNAGDDGHALLMKAIQIMRKTSSIDPSDRKFQRLLRSTFRKLLERDHDQRYEEAAEEIVGEGGLIERAFEIDVTELDVRRGMELLRFRLHELTVVLPLRNALHKCRVDDGHPQNLGDILEALRGRVRALDTIGTEAIKTVGDEWQEHTARLQPFRNREMVGLRTGMPELDRRTLGLRGIFILGAKPGAGKSTYACVEIALGVCRHYDENSCIVVILSLDMDRFDLYRRIHSNLGDIEWSYLMFGSPKASRIRDSEFSQAHQACLEVAERKLHQEQAGNRLTILDRESLGDAITPQRLKAIFEVLKSRAGAKRVLLVVDYLQLVPVPEEVASQGDLAADKYRVRLIQQALQDTRTADNPLGDTALLISEARKPPTSKDAWGDSMSELMGSARLGYAGDAVLLYREMSNREMDNYYGVSAKEEADRRREALKEQGVVPVMIILEKGRDGMIRGKWGAEFHYKKSMFRELPPGPRCLPPPDEPATSVANGRGAVTGTARSNGIALPLPSPGHAKKKARKTRGNDVDIVETPRQSKPASAGKEKHPPATGSSDKRISRRSK